MFGDPSLCAQAQNVFELLRRCLCEQQATRLQWHPRQLFSKDTVRGLDAVLGGTRLTAPLPAHYIELRYQ